MNNLLIRFRASPVRYSYLAVKHIIFFSAITAAMGVLIVCGREDIKTEKRNSNICANNGYRYIEHKGEWNDPPRTMCYRYKNGSKEEIPVRELR